MSDETYQRLFGLRGAFNHPVTLGITVGVAVIVVAAPLIIWLMSRPGRIDAGQRDELMKRYKSWLVLIPLMGLPVLLGAAWTMGAVAILSLLCYREYARATGLFREKMIIFMVVLGVFVVTFAVLDH